LVDLPTALAVKLELLWTRFAVGRSAAGTADPIAVELEAFTKRAVRALKDR
jgi:hypothetical protein